MANVHNSDAKSFVCERCGKSFPSSVAFKAHMKSHQLFHMCTFCERIFTAKTKLRDHLGVWCIEKKILIELSAVGTM